MKPTSIWTVRKLKHQVFRQIVEEWEDDFSAELGLPLRDMSGHETRANGRFGALIRRFSPPVPIMDDSGRIRRTHRGELSLAFLLWPAAHPASFWVQSDVLPVVIDFWGPHLPKAEQIFSRSPCVFVTNVEIKRDLAATGLSPKLYVLPLSVSARHVRPVTTNRTIDLIQVGRQNAKLHRWALDYVSARPGSEYLYADTRGTWPCWTSTARGKLDVDTSRATYWNLLRASRVSLVSAPGIDGGELRTGGYNPVTPRFYESAAARCHLIGRFPKDGADFVANRVASVCLNVETFDEFVASVDHARAVAPDSSMLDGFLVGHTTVEVARAWRAALGQAELNIAA